MFRKYILKFNSIPIAARASIAYAVCSVLQKCISLITLPLFTRMLTTEQYGQVTIYTSWTGLLGIILTLNLAYGSFSTAMVEFEDKRNEYISSIEGICILLSGIFIVIYFMFRTFWNQLFELPTYMMLFMILEIFFSSVLQFWMGKERFEYQYKSIVAVTMIIAILSPLLSFVFVWFSTEKGMAKIMGGALPGIAIGLYIFLKSLLKCHKLCEKKYWQFALGFNVPLIVYYLSQMIFNQSDRIMISHLCGASDAALYGLSYNIAIMLSFILNAINNSYVPWLYEKIKSGNLEKNKRMSSGIALLMAVLLGGVIWFGPEIILVLGGEKYKGAIGVLFPVAVSQLLLLYSQFSINIEFYYKEKGYLVGASIGAALLNIVMNFIFIPLFGYVAAGYTTLVSYAVFAAANAFALKKLVKKKNIRLDAYSLKILIFIFLMLVAFGTIGMLIYNTLIIRMICLMVSLISVILCRKKIMEIIYELKAQN